MIMTKFTGSLPLPEAFGFDPHKFPSWRPFQEEAILEIVDMPKRFLMPILKTGAGKSLTYMTAALYTGLRVLFLTSTKGLQDQLANDFGDKMVTIMGKSNYRCRWVDGIDISCDEGPCKLGSKCPYKESGCYYYDKVAEAKRSNLVSTNYAYWIKNSPMVIGPENGDPIGQFDMIVCDEGHDVVNNLLDALSTTITKRECEDHEIEWITTDTHEKTLQDWLKHIYYTCESDIDYYKEQRHMSSGKIRYKIIKTIRLKNKVDFVSSYFNLAEWEAELFPDKIKFDPVWPIDLAEPLLFKDVPKIVLTSATIRPQTMSLLGIKGMGDPRDDDCEFICHDYPNPFPKERRPVYLLPRIRVDSKMTNDDKYQWMLIMDQFLKPRLNLGKIIIHTISYNNKEFIARFSRHREHMYAHTSGNIREVVQEFKKRKPPCVLLSPSITTGYDFPYDDCHYQIICKIPFPNLHTKVDRRRKEIDKTYGQYLAMQLVQQAAGRIMRAENDYCETLVPDAHGKWFFFKPPTCEFATKDFRESIQMVDMVPPPGKFK